MQSIQQSEGEINIIISNYSLIKLLAVDPPENLRIFDPGYLGLLQINWSLPKSANDNTECRRYYQLEYFDTNSDSWTVG